MENRSVFFGEVAFSVFGLLMLPNLKPKGEKNGFGASLFVLGVVTEFVGVLVTLVLCGALLFELVFRFVPFGVFDFLFLEVESYVVCSISEW